MVIYFPNEWVLYLILHFTFLSFGNLFARLTQINLVYLLGSFTLCLFYLMSILYHDQRVNANPETGKTDIYSVTFVTLAGRRKNDPRRGHLLLSYEVSSRTEDTNSPLHDPQRFRPATLFGNALQQSETQP